MTRTKHAELRHLIELNDILIAPGAYDPYMARLVEQAGFQALYMTGAGVSHVRLGVPDLGLLSFHEMLDQAARIVDATSIPLIADADTGYGNAMNVARSVAAYEKAGVSACHIEDQVMPKRCGHFDEKSLIPLPEMLGKLRAAQDARVDSEFVIIARTDARTVDGFDAAMERAHAFAEEQVDMVFVESPLSENELEAIGNDISVPVLANMVETGKTPLLDAERLEALGFSVVIHPGAIGRFVAKQVPEFLARFRREGSTISQLDNLATFSTQNEIVGLSRFRALAKRYGD